MSRILFVLFALAFVQLAKSQTTACVNAINAISSRCVDTLDTLDPSGCTGTCGTQWAAAESACQTSRSNAQVRLYLGAYETTCLSGADCMDDLRALNADSTCIDALDNGEADIFCSGTCRDLIDATFDACPMNDFYSRADFNQVCGSGSMLQASGIITLLVVAICALIVHV